MTLEGQPGVAGADPRAVVGDEDALHSAAGNFDLDAAGPRVQGVFDQLLDDRRRALYNLARGDLIRERRGHDLDSRLHWTSFRETGCKSTAETLF